MGFFERLRQEKDARDREALRQTQVAKSKSLFDQQKESTRQAEAFHHNQRMKAEQTVKESGIDTLLDELANLVKIHGYPIFLYGRSKELERRHIPIRNVDSCNAIFKWDIQKRKVGKGSGPGYYDYSEKYFAIEACPDGVIKIAATGPGDSTINSNQWRSANSLLEVALERAFNNPRVYKWRDTGTSDQDGRGECLPGDVLITTPIGSVPIKSLKVGDFVWTSDKSGRKVKSRIIQNCRRVVPKNHKIAHLILKDGRELFVSAYHPTITGKPVIGLNRGQFFDGSLVCSINVIPYKGKYTYDILPAGETGSYWANNILLGSTLFSSKFESFLTSNISWLQGYGFNILTYTVFSSKT